MDIFTSCLSAANLVGQGILHTAFVCRFTRQKWTLGPFAVYFLLLCACEWCFSQYVPIGISATGVQLLILYGVSRLLLKNRRPESWAAAILAVYISQFAFGVVNSAEAMVFPCLVGKPLLYFMILLAEVSAFTISACCSAAALEFLSPEEDRGMPYLALLLVACLFFFVAELYILRTSYYNLPVSSLSAEMGKHTALFLLQVLGLGTMLCTLYAYRRVCREVQSQAALRSLTQAARAQRIYTEEAQARYVKTRAFRHDIRNHLSVLSGLLNGGRAEEAAAYLQKLEAASSALSFPVCTGNPVVDVLLGEKLEAAKSAGISTEASLCLPDPCGADDFDLCVIFANALDNAITACQSAGEKKSLRIGGERQGDFYRLIFENTCSGGPMPPMGTGLSNIKTVAEKYHGAMLAEKTDRRFFLHVLLNIS